MCGIVAYIGEREAQPLLLDALSRLEYRGYDSAGIATSDGTALRVVKRSGRIADLASKVQKNPHPGQVGISHTRWATHGEPTDENAHPHLDQAGLLALVHNGVIENYQQLKTFLESKGHTFLSATDTEVLAHLIGFYYEQSDKKDGKARLLKALTSALNDVKGTYGLALMHQNYPGLILGARRGSPLVLGIGEKEQFLASDTHALSPYTQKVVYLKDSDLVVLDGDTFEIETLGDTQPEYEVHELDFKPESAELGGYPHFMLKEIFDQPSTIREAIRGRISHEDDAAVLGGLEMTPKELREIDRIVAIACGTALHSAMAGEHIIETLAGIPMETDNASEFRYRNCPLDRNTIFFAVSQSGETADTLGGLREARRKGFRCLGICNTVGSTIARESDGGVYMHAGPEIGVAATKTFVSQMSIWLLLGLMLGRTRMLSASMGRRLIEGIEKLPGQIETILQQSDQIKILAEKYAGAHNMLFFGRLMHFPIALEGALKMKEISYIHAEGYPSAELKHGVIALVEPGMPSIMLSPQDSMYDKNISSIQEIKARKGPVIAIGNEGDSNLSKLADDAILIPKAHELLQPVLSVIPLQLFSYHMAVALGRDVDKPRNLAKSVTVE